MSVSYSPTDYSKTWMLFESGNAVEVDLSLYTPSPEQTRPVDAYVVTECAGDFTRSARRASEAVYDIVRRRLPELDRMVVGYDVKGPAADSPITDESGGLALAIALAKRLLKQDPGPVAATGKVESGHNGGPLGWINGFEKKIKAAAELVREGGWIFYPQKNAEELPAHVREALEDKGVRLEAVSSIAEAIDKLFAPATPAGKTRKWKMMIAGLILLLAGIVVGAGLRINNGKGFSFSALAKRLGITQGSETTPAASTSTGIHIAGNTTLEAELAQLLTNLIKNRINSSDSGLSHLTGRVRIPELRKGPANGPKDYQWRLTVSVKDLTAKDHNGTRSLPSPTVLVQGGGSAKSLLPEAASTLAAEIISLVNDRQGDVKNVYGDQGFE
ncbi:MAG: hypothetical protein GY850_06115 [bacterium]|nr:hypothetical protein [bacterium]